MLSFAGLAFVVYMVVDNLDLLVGGRAAANWVCVGLAAAFLAGRGHRPCEGDGARAVRGDPGELRRLVAHAA